MKKSYKIATIAVVIITLVSFAGYSYVMKGGARDIASETPAFTITAADLSAEFTKDSEAASKKYLNKAVEITGKVSTGSAKEIAVNENIICSMQEPCSLKEGDVAYIKGRLIGFDDLLGEIRLDQCHLIK